jgi:hypothetical protein
VTDRGEPRFPPVRRIRLARLVIALVSPTSIGEIMITPTTIPEPAQGSSRWVVSVIVIFRASQTYPIGMALQVRGPIKVAREKVLIVQMLTRSWICFP